MSRMTPKTIFIKMGFQKPADIEPLLDTAADL